MKYKTLFRMLLKAIGILFVGLSIDSLFIGIATIVQYLELSSEMGTMIGELSISYFLLTLCPGVLSFSLGLYLFFGGEWIVNKAIPSNRPYCPECGYDLSKTKGERCPECGTALPSELIGK